MKNNKIEQWSIKQFKQNGKWKLKIKYFQWKLKKPWTRTN